MRIDIGAVNRGMAAGAPAGSLHQTRGVGHTAYGDRSGSCQLSMAFQTQIVVALDEQLLIDRAMGVMAGCTPFPQRLVFKYVRPALLAVTL
jgi:hypothetical protein